MVENFPFSSVSGDTFKRINSETADIGLEGADSAFKLSVRLLLRSGLDWTRLSSAVSNAFEEMKWTCADFARAGLDRLNSPNGEG